MKLKNKSIRKRQVLTIIIYAIVQLLSLISPRIMQKMVDDYIPNGNNRYVAIGIGLFILIPLIMVIMKTVYNYSTIKYVRKTGNDYSLRIMENIVYGEMSFFDGKKSIETLSYISKEIVQYVNFYVVELSQYYVQFVVGAITLIEVFKINVYLGLFQLLYIPMTIFPTRKIMKSVDSEIATVVGKNAEINQIKGDTLRAIDTVKSYRLEEQKLSEVDAHNNAINKIWGKVAALDTLSNVWSYGFMTALFTGVSFGIGALTMMKSGNVSTGQLIAFITYGSMFYAAVNSIIQTKIAKKKQDSEFDVAFSYLNMVGEREENAGKKAFSVGTEIRFKDCSYSYGNDENILDKINVAFPIGKWTGIIGASGKGKTTILDIILRMYKVDSNMVFFDETDINDIDAFSIRDNITKVSQDVFLFPGTIRENLLLINPEATSKEIEDVLDFACLSEYIAGLPKGIDTDIGEIGKLMSGGERQRLGIAMGLLRKSKILLLDEVTSNIDSETESLLAEKFRMLKEKGYTIISVSHKRDFLKYADAIYDMGD